MATAPIYAGSQQPAFPSSSETSDGSQGSQGPSNASTAFNAIKSTPGLGGRVEGILDGIFGGKTRDEWRTARLVMYQSGVHAGSVTAGRYLYGQATQNVNEHEQDWYAYAIAQEERDYPFVMQRAKELGGLFDADVNVAHGVTLIHNELAGMGIDWDGKVATPAGSTPIGIEVGTQVNKAVNGVRETAASAAQRIGAGVTNAATQAIAPDGSALKHPLTIPTTYLAVGVGIAVLVGGLWLLRRK